jgi:hypothetical protein
MVTVKAAHLRSIVVLRVPRDVGLAELRARLHRKFVVQEGVPLAPTFTMAYVLPATIVQPDEVDPSRARTRATASRELSIPGIPDLTKVRFVTSQVEWKMVVESAREGKLTLRIIDTIS